MKKFLVYVDDNIDVFKKAVIADTEQEARDYVKGCGEVVAVKDVTETWGISLDEVEALLGSRYGQIEIDFILQVLRRSGLFED